MLLLALFLLCVGAYAEDYALVIDAGSTGSRAFVYRFSRDAETGTRTVIAVNVKKVLPGLSSFGANPQESVAYLRPLLLDAADVMDKEHHAKTKVYIKATAGMRLIPEEEQSAIWAALIEGLTNDPSIPFNIGPENFGTIDGYYEAYYAVLASNYIAGRIDGNLKRVPGTNMVGAMDMGGSSTQLIFYNGTGDEAYVSAEHFWSHSWLSYGVVKVRERLWEHLVVKHTSSVGDAETETPQLRVPNPCTHVGHEEEYSDNVSLHGVGDPEQCTQELKALIWQEETCSPGLPCPVGGVEHPEIGPEFYGMSVYFFALDCIKHFLGEDALPSWPNPSISELKAATHKFCSYDWQALEEDFGKNKHPYTRTWQLPQRCVEALYMITLLENGFGLDADYRGITLALEVEGKEVEWTLGYALSEVHFYDDEVLGDVEELFGQEFARFEDELFSSLEDELARAKVEYPSKVATPHSSPLLAAVRSLRKIFNPTVVLFLAIGLGAFYKVLGILFGYSKL